MKFFITGCGGYIGTTLAEQLLASGHQVCGFDRWFFGENILSDLILNPGFIKKTGDIRSIQHKDLEGYDVVIDLAALSNDPSGDLNPAWTTQINHLGRVRVAKKAKEAGISRYVLASSCSVYGQGKSNLLIESTTPLPISEYAKANLAAEQDILPLSSENFSVSIARQATVFGLSRRMRFDLVINLMTINAIEKGKIFITGGGKQWRPIVHVRDAASALEFLGTSDLHKITGEIFNIGHSNMKIHSIAHLIRETLPFPIELNVTPDDEDRRNYNVSFNKINQLGWVAKKSPEDAILEIYAAVKNGYLHNETKSQTVNWYKYLIESQKIVNSVLLDGKLLEY